MDPCPVMMAISEWGRVRLTSVRKSRPDMLGIIKSARIISGASASIRASADSALSAWVQRSPSELPTVMQSLRMLSWSSTIMRWKFSLLIDYHPKQHFHALQQLCHSKRLLDAWSASLFQNCHRFLIHRVARDEQHAM